MMTQASAEARPLKEAVIEMIRCMPDDASMADIMEALQVRLRIDEALNALNEGQGIPHETAKEQLARWLT